MLQTIGQTDLLKLITVVNVNAKDKPKYKTYIGRQAAGKPVNPLSNPFKIIKGTRDRAEAVAQFSHWLKKFVIMPGVNRRDFINVQFQDCELLTASRNRLAWADLVKLAKQAKAGKELNLSCFCAPQACHGDVIKSAIIWLIETGRV